MDVIPEPIQFEWDKGNINKSFEKHGVRNEEAEEVFTDEKALLTEDIRHSEVERRFQIIGIIKSKRLLNIVFTIRKKKIRIISARVANKKERNLYEKEKDE